MAQVEELLDECPTERRGWEWHYLKRLCHTDLLTIEAHSGAVDGVAYSPDGTRLVSASLDGTVRVWDAITGRAVLPPLRGHTGVVCAVAYSPAGKQLATAGQDKTVRIWDLTTAQSIRILADFKFPVSTVAFSPDGRRLVSGDVGGYVRVWDVMTSLEVRFSPLKGHYAFVFSVAYSPDGRRLASGAADSLVWLWNATTGEKESNLWGAASSGATAVAFSPDGRRLATGSKEGTLRVWDVATGRQIRTFTGHTDRVWSVAFSADGSRLASASAGGTVLLWDVRTGLTVHTFEIGTAATSGLAFSPDGTRRATCDQDCRGRLWDARPWTPEAAIEREALGLLDSLFAKPLRKADAIDYLKNAPTIRPRARDLALSLVDRYHEETNPETYHQESWALVRQPYLNAIQYRFALLQAEDAWRLAPDRQEYRIGLGAAQYRAGRYREPIEIPGRADRLDEDSPTKLAFLAMAHHRLGQQAQARAVLVRVREVLDHPRVTTDAETLDLMHEAEALIAPQAATNKK
jgi:WD40 repeat protein